MTPKRPHRIYPRLAGESPRKPLRKVQSMDTYRALQGPKIRQYYSTGDPIRDKQATSNVMKFFLVLLGLIFAIVFIVLVVKKT